MDLRQNLGIYIKRITDKEIGSIQQIVDLSFSNYNLGNISDYINNQQYEALGAYINDILVGFIIVQTCLDQADIILIAVHPEYRNLGIGRTLICSIPINNLYVEVSEINSGAIEFYKNTGFKVISSRNNYYKLRNGQRVIALVMKRT